MAQARRKGDDMNDQIKTNPAGYRNFHTLDHKLRRLAWGFTYYLLFRFSPVFLVGWRNIILRVFGAKLGRAWVHPSVKIYAPWKLQVGHESFVGPDVEIYNDFGIEIGQRVVVSQRTFLCSATHDYTDALFPLTGGRIIINDDVWVAAEAFVAPGVTVGTGAVVGACAVVTKDVAPWTVVAGNPAKFIKKRVMRS